MPLRCRPAGRRGAALRRSGRESPPVPAPSPAGRWRPWRPANSGAPSRPRRRLRAPAELAIGGGDHPVAPGQMRPLQQRLGGGLDRQLVAAGDEMRERDPDMAVEVQADRTGSASPRARNIAAPAHRGRDRPGNSRRGSTPRPSWDRWSAPCRSARRHNRGCAPASPPPRRPWRARPDPRCRAARRRAPAAGLRRGSLRDRRTSR